MKDAKPNLVPWMIAQTDPNWFFSTLSQSAAAVVGIVGGFFISRLLQHVPAVRESRDGIFDDFVKVRTTAVAMSDALVSYSFWANQLRAKVEDALSRGDSELMLNHWQVPGGGGGSSSAPQPYPIYADWPRELDDVDTVKAAIVPYWSCIAQMTDLSELPRLADEYEKLDVLPMNESLWHQYDAHSRELSRTAREIIGHQGRAVPGQAPQLLLLLGSIAGVGILLPLAFLSAGDGSRASAKYLLLFAFAIGLVLLGVVLRRLIGELHEAADLMLPERLFLPPRD
jgi:hypothetical protein